MLRKTAWRELVNGLSKPRYTQLNVVRDWEKDPAYHKIVPPALGKWKLPAIPENIKLPHYAVKSGSSPWDDIIPLAFPVGPPEFYDEHLAPGMRKAGRIAAECLQYATSLVKPGVTTRVIDKKVTEWAFEHNCYPSSLNYGGADYEGGFPGSLCTSVNNVLSHGVPNDLPLLEGSIINLDIALYVPYEPADTCYHGDTSTTVGVGEISEKSQRLLKAAKEALKAGIDVCGPLTSYSKIGKAIEAVAHKYGMQVVKDLCGHGVGKDYHQYPIILHYRNEDDGAMAPGTVFTIEPCLVAGVDQHFTSPEDNFSICSLDGGRGAQEEHTVMVTDTGVEVLTQL